MRICWRASRRRERCRGGGHGREEQTQDCRIHPTSVGREEIGRSNGDVWEGQCPFSGWPGRKGPSFTGAACPKDFLKSRWTATLSRFFQGKIRARGRRTRPSPRLEFERSEPLSCSPCVFRQAQPVFHRRQIASLRRCQTVYAPARALLAFRGFARYANPTASPEDKYAQARRHGLAAHGV